MIYLNSMKSGIMIFGCALAVLVTACTPHTQPFKVSNTLDYPVKDKTVVLTVEEVAAYLPLAKEGKAVLAADASGKAWPTQNDDVDGDGQWDELSFLVSMEAASHAEVVFRYAESKELEAFPKRTNVRFGYKTEPFAEVSSEKRLKSIDSPTIQAIFQMEGPVWENDMVGFRNYYDARNGMDIFGKKTDEMVLDSVGIRGQQYHEMDSWGMDILKVGNSLGAGAIALQIGDSLYRIGPCETGAYRFITEGPVRAMFELTFKGFVAQGRSYDITHQISIRAGEHFYCRKVWIGGLQGDEYLVTGIVDKYELPVIQDAKGSCQVVATHGAQAYTHENLGLAVLVKSDDLVEQYAAPKEGEGIVETHLAKLKVQNPTEFAFVVGWEYQDGSFATQDGFMDMCRKSIDRFE